MVKFYLKLSKAKPLNFHLTSILKQDFTLYKSSLTCRYSPVIPALVYRYIRVKLHKTYTKSRLNSVKETTSNASEKVAHASNGLNFHLDKFKMENFRPTVANK